MSDEPRQVIDLGFRPHKYQQELIEAFAKHRFSVAVCHRRFGKSRLAVQLLLATVLRCSLPRPRAAYVAPLLRQAKATAWLYLVDAATRIPGHRVLEGELAVELPGDRRVSLHGGSEGNEEWMRGLYFDGVVLDEYAHVAPHMLDQIILPTLSDRKGWLVAVGTPRGQDAFYRLFHEDAPQRGWHRSLYRVDETWQDIPWLSEEELTIQRQNSGELAWRQEWLCDFTAAASNALLTIDLVSAACQREYAAHEIEWAPVILGIDVARYGDDRSVIQRRQGRVAFEPEVFTKVDNMRLAGIAADRAMKFKADAIFVDAGRGEGVIDRLKELGFPVREVNFGGKALHERYADKRSEMWDLTKQWLEAGGKLPNHPELKTDLCGPTYAFTSAGKFRLEAKDDMRSRGLRSTDLGDALALTFAQPIAPRERCPVAPVFSQPRGYVPDLNRPPALRFRNDRF